MAAFPSVLRLISQLMDSVDTNNRVLNVAEEINMSIFTISRNQNALCSRYDLLRTQSDLI